jgi:hypothetical protein
MGIPLGGKRGWAELRGSAGASAGRDLRGRDLRPNFVHAVIRSTMLMTKQISNWYRVGWRSKVAICCTQISRETYAAELYHQHKRHYFTSRKFMGVGNPDL